MAVTKDLAEKLLEEFRYTLPNDVNMRLKSCIIRFRDRPVYVHATHENLTCVIVDLLTLDSQSVHSSNAELDISSPPLGWVNLNGGYPCGYLMRTAKNSQKQGVSPQHMPMYLAGRVDDNISSFQWNDVSDLQTIGKTIAGIFPSIAMLTQKGSHGGAFDREWAIVNMNTADTPNHYTLYHRTVPVGTYFARTGIFFFRRGRLTKTRRASLEAAFNNIYNRKEIGRYGIKEQL